MIEARLLPIALGVARFAFRAKRPLVRIVLAMTRGASRGRRALLRAGRVAALALHRLMSALQRKVGLRMIEARLVQADDARLAALVLGMAEVALAVLQPAVIAALRAHVGGDFFMAVEAELRLRGAVEAHMAVAAVLFQLGVRLDERSGHDRPLEVLR